MPRYRQTYSLTKIGSYYYYRTYDERGKRTTAKSTGETNKTKARIHCDRLHREGKLVPRKSATLAEWAESAHWWEYDQCAYIRGRLERSPADKPAVSPRYAHDAKVKLENHILPVFGKKKLDAITPAEIEDWMMDLRIEWSRATVNNVATILRVMLTEAYRLDMIPANPFEKVRPLTVDHKPRGILTIDEARTVLDPSRWANPLYYAATLIAAFTGMRRGEVLAIRTTTLAPDHIVVDASWHPKYGLQPTKTKRPRVVPIPKSVYEVIQQFLAWEGFVLSLSNGKRPINGGRVTEALKTVLVGCEIDWRARNIGYHSWRHFANTYYRRTGVPDAELKAVTGHATDAMTEHYTHYQVGDFRAVIAAQEQLLVGGGK